MTIYVNARFLTQPMSGVQRYARELLGAFDRRLEDDPGLARALHTDCPAARAKALAADGATFSLHGFGGPLFALGGLFILTTLFLPDGVAGLIRKTFGRRAKAPEGKDEDTAPS